MNARQKLDQAIQEYAASRDEDGTLVSLNWILGWEATHFEQGNADPISYVNSYAISETVTPAASYGISLVTTEMIAEGMSGSE